MLASREEAHLRTAALTVGTCSGEPGRLTYGIFPGADLPTGSADALPVIIAQGKEPGPVLWLTANIHGNEVAGIPAVHRLLNDELCGALRGAVVALPTLNPAGLRTNKRRPYNDDRDPNRTFPGARKAADEGSELTVYERLASRLLGAIGDTADYYIDLHCASILSVPFVIRDRVLYRNEAQRSGAAALSDALDAMAAAFGFPVVAEYPPSAYVAKELHRSTTGAALQELRLPSLTAELGAHTIVDEQAVAATVGGLRNVMRWAGMLSGPAEKIAAIPQPPHGRRLRRQEGPYPAGTGLLDFCVGPGSFVKAGGVVAGLKDIWGRPIGDGFVKVSTDAWILGIEDGMLAYPGAPIAHIAVEDDAPLIDAWPA
ncbi:MAG: succinylglutamate desuccinylase/aspartoacylase family protein [Candidatus Eremiobacteraeota bacterium]|nr:succinylglutamate desuccinylase/aspartoacylase family protein [Candidatus Eremiobacteraeota bacterium]MBC5826730.1 succinylglutamate desuccinylase/aspartoacylase family protein [Candidatus Eremiobacteraeota bacterium]